MKHSSAVFVEPVPGSERQELELGLLEQIGRFVEDNSPGLHSHLQRSVQAAVTGGGG